MHCERNPLNEEEILQLTGLLSRLEPGRQPFPIFKELTRITTVPVIELVSFIEDGEDELGVLLTRRDDTDMFWPNQLHVPGTIILATDEKEGYDSSLKRLRDSEMQQYDLRTEPEFVTNVHRQTARGSEAVVVYAASLYNDIPRDEIYPVNNLPLDVIDVHVPLIEFTVDHFRSNKR